MNYPALFQFLRLALRLAEAALSRRAPPSPSSAQPTRAGRAVPRVAPVAGRVLDRVLSGSRRAQRLAWVSVLAHSAALGALAAGGAAYVILQQQRRLRARYRPVQASFPEALLEVLAAPGGGGRLQLSYGGDGLSDPRTGRLYPVVDGIPDFLLSAEVEAEYLAGLPAPEEGARLRLGELLAPLGPRALGVNHAGNAALAGAVAAAASDGWALAVPCGPGGYELEMARANPLARILCVDDSWDRLLEIRRRALEAGLAGLYFVRGDPLLLPLQDASLAAAWTEGGLHRCAEPERVIAQIVRAARPGAPIAGVSLVAGGPLLREALGLLCARRRPGRRGERAHVALLRAAGLADLRTYRDGGFVRFSAVRA